MRTQPRPPAIREIGAKATGLPSAQLGEGPIWHGERNILSWVDISTGTLTVRDIAAMETKKAEFTKTIGFACPRRAGGFICGNHDRLVLLDDALDMTGMLAEIDSASPRTRINDGKCDINGRLWVGTMGMDGRPDAGALYKVEANGTVARIIDGIGTANGLGWSPDTRVFYFTDSRRSVIYAFDYDAEAGAVSRQREFVRMGPGEGRPDGLTVDSEGHVWTALWDGARVVRFDPKGRPSGMISVPVPRPTSIALGGTDLCTAFITTAREGLTKAQLAQATLSGSIFSAQVDVPGLPADEFAG